MRYIIPIIGDIDQDMFEFVHNKIIESFDEEVSEYQVILNSEGGDPYQALAIIDLFKFYKISYRVHAIGECSSSACPILASGSIRTASRNIQFMYHPSKVNVDLPIQETFSYTKSVDNTDKRLNKIMAKASSIPREFWDSIEKDTYFTANELKKMKLISKII